MKKLTMLPLLLFICISVSVQKSQANAPWVAASLSNKVFIENKGQFNAAPGIDAPILFGIENSMGEQIFFTKNGVVFLYTVPRASENELSEASENKNYPVETEKITVDYYHVKMNWSGASDQVQVIAENQATEKFSFFAPDAPEGVIHCDVFKKIVYKNLYPGIDIEYTFHPEQGLKYNILVHAGADASSIAMIYSGADNILLDGNGDLMLNSVFGNIKDKAPKTSYSSDASAIGSSFDLQNNVVRFHLDNYDNTRDVIIDPWVISPGFTTQNRGYDISRRASNGDIYVMGGYPRYEVKKYTSAGALIYTYVTNPIYGGAGSNYYGDMEIDPATGDFFISAGCCNFTVSRINGTSQAVMWTNPGYYENWRLKFNPSNNQLIDAGYVLSGGQNIASINPATGALINSATIIAPIAGAEIRAIDITPTGTILVMHVTGGQTSNPATNRLTSNTSAFIMNYNVQNGYSLNEFGAGYAYNDNTGFYPALSFHGFNGIADNGANFIYTYDGATIIKRDLSTGAQLATVASGGQTDINSGIAVNACGDVFVGTQNQIKQYDANLNFISAQSTTGAVYDVIIGGNNEILASGNSFVGSFNFPSSCSSVSLSISSVDLTCNNVCNGSATATATSGNTPYTYLWNTGDSAQTISNLCAGTYAVTVTDASGASATDSVTITQPAALSLSVSSSNPICNGNCTNVSAIASGGTGSLTYLWNPNIGSGPGPFSVCPSVTTVYNLSVTDSNGCVISDSVVVPVSPGPSVTIATTNSGLCNANVITVGYGPQTLTLTAVSPTAVAWLWSTGDTTQTISVTQSGVYTVVVWDAAGCMSPNSPPAADTITVVDVRCGHNLQKVILCHVPPGNPGNPQTICVAASAIPHHLANHPGDCIGPCSLYYPRPGPASDADAAVFTDIEQAFYVDAYPNPFSGTFLLQIHASSDAAINISIHDMLGRLVETYDKVTEQTEIGNNLKAGVYFVEAIQDGNMQRIRIVKE